MFIFFNTSPSIIVSAVFPLHVIHFDASETIIAAVQLDGPLAYQLNIDYGKQIYVK
jgi:hypothetical protein